MKYEDLAVLGLYAETAMHPGTEGTAGYIDMPVQRERHTEYPVIPGSTIKGVLRAAFKGAEKEEEEVKMVFGKEDGKGGISVADGMIAAFPVRSLMLPFFWVTCPFVIERIRRILDRYGRIVPPVAAIEDGNARTAGEHTGQITLEDQLVTAEGGLDDGIINAFKDLLPADETFEYTRALLKDRLLVVSDACFRDFVRSATQVVTRIRIDQDTGTVAKGAYFIQELIPADTIFISSIRGSGTDEAKDYIGWLGKRDNSVIRLGGDETIGRGITHTHVTMIGSGGEN
ncbi:type III-B CRISPR module RAMP protein Cmr4 [bacterium]|nr:type III-B CRISPR module RAMP protein Cmr4 [bacterium]